jgi:hypothetical protein
MILFRVIVFLEQNNQSITGGHMRFLLERVRMVFIQILLLESIKKLDRAL